MNTMEIISWRKNIYNVNSTNILINQNKYFQVAGLAFMQAKLSRREDGRERDRERK
jgi:hypothetical protein